MSVSDTYPREIELKFELEPDSAEPVGKLLTLWSRERKGRAEELVSVYYDTDAQDLRDGGFSLRVRKEGGRWMQTAKSGQASSTVRGEWDVESPDGELRVAAFSGTPVEGLLDKLGRSDGLKPQFKVKVQRTRRCIRSKGQEVEASLDSGVVEANGRSAQLCELELELKQGEPKDLFKLARSIAENEPLRLSFVSKAERGYALLAADASLGIHARKGVVRRGMTACEAFQTIGRECLLQLSGNEAVLRRIRSPDAVHQARVALRRFRAALSLFKDVVVDGRVETMKSEMKWLAGELGEARNLDVFADVAFRPLAGRGSHIPGMESLGAELLARQDGAYAKAAAAFGSERYRALLLDAAEWIEVGDWLGPKAKARPELDKPAEDFAAKVLKRRFRKMRKDGRDLAKLDAEGRHELRIDGKKLRYALEFFQALPKGKPKRRHGAMLKALKPLQEVLGDLNDIVTGTELAAGLARDASDPSPELGFAAGIVAGRRHEDEAALCKRLEKVWAKFENADPVW
jgi:inorganic triphosphatase YgiF